jgi:transposase
VVLLLTEDQASDHRGAALMLHKLPPARELIGDRGYGTEGVQRTQRPLQGRLAQRGIDACIPSTRSRKQPIPHDATLYRQRHRIEIMFGRLKDRRRIAMRYDRCAHTFFSAITLAATVTFWLKQ